METDGAAREARKTFDLLVEHFPDMIHSVDTDGNLVYVNRAATALLGYSADELRGLNIRQLYPPEIQEAVERGFRDVKQGGGEARREPADGQGRHAHPRGTAHAGRA